MKKEIGVKIVLLIFVIAMGIYCYKDRESRQPIEVSKNLKAIAVTVDGEALTLRDMAFYIAYQEKEVQDEAILYNPKNPRRYWNTHTNGHFIRVLAEEAVINMAVHDELFYRLAEENELTLTEEEEAYLANEVLDFCGDLKEAQYERLGVTPEELEASMRKIALANKYQSILAQMEEVPYEAYNYTGENYEAFVSGHEVELNEAVWDRVTVGKVTVNY